MERCRSDQQYEPESKPMLSDNQKISGARRSDIKRLPFFMTGIDFFAAWRDE
jgi:hypothetical protein